MTGRTREQALEELVQALDKLLVAYRLGYPPHGALLDTIARLRSEVQR